MNSESQPRHTILRTSMAFVVFTASVAAFGCNRAPDSGAAKDTASASAVGARPTNAAVAGHSTPPTTGEWAAAGEVTVRNSTSLKCETKMVREWLRVSCKSPASDNAVTGLQVVRPTGDREYFVFQTANLASAVLPVREGTNALVRFTWEKWGTRELTVSLPRGAPSAAMSFDRGGEATPAAVGLQCKTPGDCPKSHCCLSATGSSCSETVCAVGAEVCTNGEDCEMSVTLKNTNCKKASRGLSTCQR